MEGRMAGLLSIMAFALLLTAWLVQKARSATVLPVETLMGYAVVVLFVYMFIGRLVARVGVDLVQEVLNEQRAREEDRRTRARQRYSQVTSEEEEEAAEPAEE